MISLFFAILLIISIGIYTASETAFLSIEKNYVRKARSEGKRWAKMVYNFMQSPEQFFTMILICEDFSLVVGSTIFAQFVIQNFGNGYLFFSTIFLSLFSLIFAQYIPKSIALTNPEKTFVLLSEILIVVKTIFTPVIFLFSLIIKLLHRLFKTQPRTDLLRHQDIVSAISEYERDTSILISRLFDFSRRPVSDVMIPISMAFICSKEDNILSSCLKRGQIFTEIPVYEQKINNIIGIVDTKEYFYSGKIILKPPNFVNIYDRCMSVFIKMKEKKEKLCIVLDDKKNVVGIVTIQDIIEELVGEIREER